MAGKRKSPDRRALEKAADRSGPVARLDLAVVAAAEPFSDHPAVKVVGAASELADQPPLVTASALVLVAGLVTRRPALARAGARMLAAHGLATLAKTIVKDRIDRTRPQKVAEDGEHRAEPGRSKAGERRSFPSGHSAGAFAVARAVTREYPGAVPVALPAAALASAIQVPRQKHFPSDVVVGVAIGLAAEALVDLAARRLSQRLKR